MAMEFRDVQGVETIGVGDCLHMRDDEDRGVKYDNQVSALDGGNIDQDRKHKRSRFRMSG